MATAGYGGATFSTSDWVLFAALGIGAYFVYKTVVKPVSDIGSGVGDTFSGIGDFYKNGATAFWDGFVKRGEITTQTPSGVTSFSEPNKPNPFVTFLQNPVSGIAQNIGVSGANMLMQGNAVNNAAKTASLVNSFTIPSPAAIGMNIGKAIGNNAATSIKNYFQKSSYPQGAPVKTQAFNFNNQGKFQTLGYATLV